MKDTVRPESGPTLADLINQAVDTLRAGGYYAHAAAVEQNALHNQELITHIEALTALLESATALAEGHRQHGGAGVSQ